MDHHPYRDWEGSRQRVAWRWLALASVGIRLVGRNTWLRLTVLGTWLPALVAAIGFFAYEQSIVEPQVRRELGQFLGQVLLRPELGQLLREDPIAARHEVWSTFLMTFFRYPQAIAMVLIVGLVAPRLISYDLRSRAYLLYFSRAMTIGEYLLGKLCIVWFFLFLITTLPALLLYVMGVLLSPEWSVIGMTWDLPLRIVAASLVLWIPTAALALAYSSLTTESRYATLAWVATWVMGAVAYGVLTASTTDRWQQASGETETWKFLSLYHVSGVVQQWIFGFDVSLGRMFAYLSILVIVTIASMATIYFRISRRLQA